jgi:hypothetical protein
VPVRLLEVEHPTDVRVMDLARQPHLARQSRGPDTLPGQLRADDFDGDHLVQVAVVRAHDHPRPAAPDDLLHRVSPGQHHSTPDRRRLDDVGRRVLEVGPTVVGVAAIPAVHRALPPS